MIEKFVTEADLKKIFDALSESTDGTYSHICYIPGNIAYWSREAADYFGLPDSSLVDPETVWLQHIEPMSRDRHRKKIEALFNGETDYYEMLYRALNKDGEYVTCSGKGRLIRDERGGPKFFVGSITNFENVSSIDPVTGLYSRDNLLGLMKEMGHMGNPYFIAVIGIHNFFDINSTYGYSFGNKVLKEISRHILNNRLSAHVFRPEGTKIVVVFDQDMIEEEQIVKKFDRLKRLLQTKLVVDGTHITIDICGALVRVDSPDMDINSVYNSALFALDKAKRNNIQEILVVDKNVFTADSKRFELLSAIRNSIVEDFKGFYLVYQPIVNANDEKVVAMEALLRWKDEKHGFVPPNEFIPWLERDPIFFELGNWILRQAMRDAKKVLNTHKNFIVNVNLAYPQLQRADFKEKLATIIEEEHFPTERLKLELTERCKLLDMDALRNDMIYFKSEGMETALDDFGTGYSALNLLISLPTDQVKIDKYFIDGIERDIPKQSLLRAITTCAREMGKSVCVEGIETREMADYIKSRFPVEYFQGYFYSKPIPIDDFIEWSVKH
ncbi:MAG: EAL domain-containing protein [Lachnospiraceae bacterium]|nr:EAL domain-containing protein [Lachnospiraceae bacterium]